LNLNGLRRHVERNDIDALRAAYRELFESGKPLQEQAAAILDETTSEFVKNFCTFIVNTKRGIPYERNQS
jgi:UDP-N-acetylglucosamine acyltransferase